MSKWQKWSVAVFVIAITVCLFVCLFVLWVDVRNNTATLKDRAAYDYVDARIEERIRFFLYYLEYEVGDGKTMPTNDVVAEIIKYNGMELEYIPPETISGQLRINERIVFNELPGDGVK